MSYIQEPWKTPKIDKNQRLGVQHPGHNSTLCHITIKIALSGSFPSTTTDLHLWEAATIPFWRKHSVSERKLSKVIWKRLKHDSINQCLFFFFLWSSEKMKWTTACLCTTSASEWLTSNVLARQRVYTLHAWTWCKKLRAPSIFLPFSIHWKPLQAKIISKKLPLCITPRTVKNVPHETRWSRSNKIFAEVQDVITQGKEVPMTTRSKRNQVRIWGFEPLTIQGITALCLEIRLWYWNPRK